MFRQIRVLKDITGELAPLYRDQVTKAGPVMGVLWLDFFMYRMPSPPASNAAPLRYEGADRLAAHKPNGRIAAVLHGGKVPFVVTCHPDETMKRWLEYLEAGTVLLLPQVVVAAELALPDYARDTMMGALKNEFESWKRRRPKLGEAAERKWLPRLM
jgi:hypothetical protein